MGIKSEKAEVSLEAWERQDQAINSPATELLFGGASEGGKSHFIRLALIRWCTEVPGLQCLILRKYYKDVLANHMLGENNFRTMLSPWVKKKLVEITENQVRFLFNGSLITLGQCRTQEDFEKAQGIAKHVLIWDEATQIPQRYLNDLRGWVRMSNEMKERLPEDVRDRFPRIVYTCNPIGESVSWFRRNFVDCRKPFEIEKVGAFTRQFIPSLITDNPSADAVAQRERLMSMHNARVAEALITGDWNSPTGNFFTEYDDDFHSVPDFNPPNHWFKYRVFDWGSADPFAVYWVCVSDGERFKDHTGASRWFPRGAIIAYREWYGCDEKDPSRGIHLRNEDIAKGIVERTKETMSGYTFSDNFPFADRGASKNHEKYTMADDFRDNGCPLTLGNTARVYGWKQVRTRLQGIEGVPMAYITKRCKYLRTYLPALGFSEKNSEDAAEDGEATHSCDAWRLAHTVRPIILSEDMPAEGPKFERFTESVTPNRLLQRLARPNKKSIYVRR